MAKNAKSRKLLNARGKGFIALVVLLAITVFVSCLAVSGMHYGEDGVNVLLPWVPVSSEDWPQSLRLSRALGGGAYTVLNASVAEGESLEEALATSKKSIEARLEALGETNALVTIEGEAIRVELPEMDSEQMHGWIEFISMPGKFELISLATGESAFSAPFAKASVGVNASNTSYELTVEFSKEDTQRLHEAVAQDGNYFRAVCDGSQISTYVSIKGDKAVMSLGETVSAAVSNAIVLCQNPVPATLTHTHDGENEGELEATAGFLPSVVLIVSATLLVIGLICLIAMGKLTGLSAIITVWCAVMLECFFYATLVRSTVTVASLIMLVVGLVLALYTAFIRTKAISALIAEGNTPKSATKLGIRTTAKQVWMAHGVLLALSLIMMIFAFSKLAGYALCCGVAGSAFVLLVMRLFQSCFMAINNKASLYGKVK